MLRCSDNSLYTGIAKDILRRVEEHNNNGLLGAKYTRPRRPVTLVYQEVMDSRSSATLRELEIKQLNKKEKEALIGGTAATT